MVKVPINHELTGNDSDTFVLKHCENNNDNDAVGKGPYYDNGNGQDTGVLFNNSIKKFGDYSMDFTNDQFVYFSEHTHFKPNENDFLDIDFWVYLNSTTVKQPFFSMTSNAAGGNSGWEFYLLNNQFTVRCYSAYPINQWRTHMIEWGYVLNTEQWHHVYLQCINLGGGDERDILRFELFVNGVSQGFDTMEPTEVGLEPDWLEKWNYDGGEDFKLGWDPLSSVYLDGKIDEWRMSHITRWTEDFSPPNVRYGEDEGNVITYEEITDPEGSLESPWSATLIQSQQSGKLMIKYRNNGDSVYKNEKEIDLGKIGDTEFIRGFDNLGIYRTRQYEIVSTGNTPVTIIGAEEDIVKLDKL